MDSLDGFQPERDTTEADRKADEDQKVKVIVIFSQFGQFMTKIM